MNFEKDISIKLWKRVHFFRHLLALCPYVRMVAVCNSLARNEATETSDIDLFIVTAPRRLYTAQFFLKCATQSFGMRVHHNKKAGRFCLSFLVTERALNLQPLALIEDTQFASFVATMQPISGAKVYDDFLRANTSWLMKYSSCKPQLEHIRSTRAARTIQWILEKCIGIFGKPLEWFFKKIQLRKDKKRAELFSKTGSIVLTDEVYKFHEYDPRLR